MTDDRAVEALAKRLILTGIWVDDDLDSPRSIAEAVLADDEEWSDADVAAIVAALLAGHEGVLAAALHVVGHGPFWRDVNTDERTGMQEMAFDFDAQSAAVVAALGAAGREGGDRG